MAAKIIDPTAKTFKELQGGKYRWWENLKKDPELSIQVRTGNTIEVYYNGGAILQGLAYDEKKESFTAEINSKFIPLAENKNLTLELKTAGIEISDAINIMDLSLFEEDKIEAIKSLIENYFPSDSEKAKQYEFATVDPCIIDTEYHEEDLRFDLVRLDIPQKRIVFIEMKKKDNPELDSTSKNDKNICTQLEKYRNFLCKHQT